MALSQANPRLGRAERSHAAALPDGATQPRARAGNNTPALVLATAGVAAAMIVAFVPHSPANLDATIRGELAALKRPQVLFAVAAGLVGCGGLFAMYSYIAPVVTDVTDLSRGWINVFLLVFGISSVFGSWAAGVLPDWNIERSVLGGFAATVVVLAEFYFAAGVTVPAIMLVFFVGCLGSVVAITLQMRLMDAAGDAQMLGAALNHSALNIANGLGAWLGGVVISAGHGYRATSLVGIALASGGLLIFAIGAAASRRTRLADLVGSDLQA